MPQFGMGQSVRRVEDKRFISGAGRYTDDIELPRQTYAAILRSPQAHARIVRIDTKAAVSSPGVFGVFTAADLEKDGVGTIPCAAPIPNRDKSPMKVVPRPCL